MLSVELGIAVALFELGLGVVVGNVSEFESQECLDFIGHLRLDRAHLPRRPRGRSGLPPQALRASVAIGLVSFMGPFIGGSIVAYLALDWTLKAALISGTARDTARAMSAARLMLALSVAVLVAAVYRRREELAIALVDLLAYVGDQLGYTQDAVASEAYLETARRRVSLRRHAQLVDYEPDDRAAE